MHGLPRQWHYQRPLPNKDELTTADLKLARDILRKYKTTHDRIKFVKKGKGEEHQKGLQILLKLHDDKSIPIIFTHLLVLHIQDALGILPRIPSIPYSAKHGTESPIYCVNGNTVKNYTPPDDETSLHSPCDSEYNFYEDYMGFPINEAAPQLAKAVKKHVNAVTEFLQQTNNRGIMRYITEEKDEQNYRNTLVLFLNLNGTGSVKLSKKVIKATKRALEE